MGVAFLVLGAGLIGAVACLLYGYPNGTDLDDALSFVGGRSAASPSQRSRRLARLSSGVKLTPLSVAHSS